MNAPEFYRFDSLRLPLRNYYALQGLSPSLVLILIQKLLRIPIAKVYWPEPSLMEVLETPPASEAGRLAQALAEDLGGQGFEPFLCYRLPTLTQPKAARSLSALGTV